MKKEYKYKKRLLVVSNRLPININQAQEGIDVSKGTGGLVTALTPLMGATQGTWIGWPGAEDGPACREAVRNFSEKHSFELAPVWLDKEDIDKYYHGFANETVWPLFHDLLGHCKFELDHWQSYKKVNHDFADAIMERAGEKDFIWVHDYQLMMVARYLRRKKLELPLAFFLHIPFPSPDLFRRLPWKKQLITALMDYDLLGFQTLRDRRNFVQCAKAFIPSLEVIVKRRFSLLKYDKRVVKVGHYPISIDYGDFNSLAKSKEVEDAAWFLHENIRSPQLILGLDRLDYTKGIPERFLALECALEKYPELQGKISLVQVLIPSRTRIPEYQSLKTTLDALTGRINGKFSTHGWVPIHYMYRTLDKTQLIGYYRACEIALVTPLKDGMNLVAKEYCASSIDNNGVLIISEFAGAADQLAKEALVVNPYDLEGTAEAIHRAAVMPKEDRTRRMRALRAKIKRTDVYRWLEWFLDSFPEKSTMGGSGKIPANVERKLSRAQDTAREMTDMKLWSDQHRPPGPGERRGLV